jgi:hypothetical protein
LQQIYSHRTCGLNRGLQSCSEITIFLNLAIYLYDVMRKRGKADLPKKIEQGIKIITRTASLLFLPLSVTIAL